MRFRKAVLLCCAGIGLAMAHHAGTAFDSSQQLVVDGTVQEFKWVNPHIWLFLQVPKAGGGYDVYQFEGASVSVFARSGWTSKTLNPGDKIQVLYSPYKEPDRKGGEFRTVTTADGKVWGWGQI
ncbi:MAG: DUF6152 family protein [Steroidobacteraceae bacterium]